MRVLAILTVLGFLAGCSLVPGVAEVQGAFVIGTDKTIEDHAISLASGKNCSSVRREKGLTYCEEDEPKVNPNIYCYKTLAKVTCYDRPDPYGGRQKKMGEDNVNVAK